MKIGGESVLTFAPLGKQLVWCTPPLKRHQSFILFPFGRNLTKVVNEAFALFLVLGGIESVEVDCRIGGVLVVVRGSAAAAWWRATWECTKKGICQKGCNLKEMLVSKPLSSSVELESWRNESPGGNSILSNFYAIE